MSVEHNRKTFHITLVNLVGDLHRYTSHEDCLTFLKVESSLDPDRLFQKVNSTLIPRRQDIKNKNAQVFASEWIILPKVDLSVIWSQLTFAQKSKVWIYLNVLVATSEFISKTITTSERLPDGLTFNPYKGIGGESDEYTVDDILAGKETDDEAPSAPGLGSMMSMLGIDKSLPINQISEQLKNMKPEDIEEATANIQKYFGKEDKATAGVMSDMLKTIQTELSSQDLSKGNPLDNIMKIADSVAAQMKPKMVGKNFDPSKLLESAQKAANDCTDENGKKLFDENNNPFQMFNQMQQSGNAPDMEAMMQQMGINPAQLQGMDMNKMMQTMMKKAGGGRPKPGAKRRGRH